MEPHEDVGTLGEAAGNEFVGADGAIGKQQVAQLEVGGKHGTGLGVMLGVRAGFDVFPSTQNLQVSGCLFVDCGQLTVWPRKTRVSHL